MNKIVITLFILLISCTITMAQNDEDALRFSRNHVVGTARYSAMGGAFGSIGADFSTLSTNPAGIALYRKSEFTITPGFYIGKTFSDYNGNTRDDYRNNFNLGNMGVVIASPPKSQSNSSLVKSFQFGVGHNRINNFNNRMLMEGFNDDHSIVDTYVENANGIYYQDIDYDYNGYYTFDLQPAWATYLIDLESPYDNTHYIGAASGGVLQRKEIETWGATNEFLFAFGANLNNRVYIGGSFAFPTIRYNRISRYTEIDDRNNYDPFQRLLITEDLQTTGSGFNMKFGLIARINDMVRLGGAIHSPTWYNNMKDNWYYVFSQDRDNVSDSPPPWETVPGIYEYDLETPWKAIGSASVIISKMAIVSAEYEYVNFAESRLRAREYNFFYENDLIRRKYQVTHNLRLGTEVVVGLFSVRGGFAYYMSPYADNINDGKRLYYSGGLGFRDKHFFMDLAYVRSVSKEDYYFYGTENIQFNPVSNKLVSSNILLTFGFRY